MIPPVPYLSSRPTSSWQRPIVAQLALENYTKTIDRSDKGASHA